MENFEELKKRLSDELCGLADDANVGFAEDILAKYGKVKECDEGIDDGIDDDDCEDEYIMYESFDIQTDFGRDIHVILYYGNNSFVFSDFNIQ